MANTTIYIRNENCSSRSMQPWLAPKRTEDALNAPAPATKAMLRRRAPSGRIPVLQHGPTAAWESLAICEFVADQPLRPAGHASGAPVAALQPTMAKWIAASGAGPWVIRDDVDAGSG